MAELQKITLTEDDVRLIFEHLVANPAEGSITLETDAEGKVKASWQSRGRRAGVGPSITFDIGPS
jgi:hypothetical protein